MKRIHLRLICGVMVLALAGCEKGGPDIDPVPAVADSRPAEGRFDVFALPDPASAQKTRCVIDRINGQKAPGQLVTVSRSANTRFNGWVSDPNLRVPERFHVVLSNGAEAYAAQIKAGLPRPDVARTLGTESLAASGFDVVLELGQVPAGTYVGSIVMEVDGAIARCPTQTRLRVGP